MSPGRQKVKIALEEKLIHLENDAYSAFSSALKVFFKWTCTTQKRKYLDKTIKNFFNKRTNKRNHERSKLKNRFIEDKNEENWCKYKIQCNYCVKLLYKTKKQYYKNLDIKEVSDNKKFDQCKWKRNCDNNEPFF